MNAKEFYLKETGWESLDQVEEFDTPEEVIGLMNKYAEHCQVPDREEEMRELIQEMILELDPATLSGDHENLIKKAKQLLNK